MKKNIKKILVIMGFVLLLFNRNATMDSVYSALNIWSKSILPSLFPFFIFSDLFVSVGIADELSNKFGNLFGKIFKLSKYSFFIFIMSLISGCPSNAKNIKNMMDNGYIMKSEAEKILSFTLFYNQFLIYTITNLFLKNKDCIKLIIIIYISNLLVGLIIRGRKASINNLIYKKNINISLVDSIKNAIYSLINILGTIIFMMILISLFKTDIPLINNIINGLLEITSGIISLKDINLSYNLKQILCLIYLSFGGLSIHMQIKSILKDTLNYKLFYLARLLVVLISLGLFCITQIY